MYLTANFYTYTVPSYISVHSTSPFIRWFNAWELRREARRELLKYTPKIDVEGLYAAAELALMSFASIIDRRKHAAGKGKPSLLEATLFSYLFLLLELPHGRWADARLVELVHKHQTLVTWEADMKPVFGHLEPPGIYKQ
jgi:hypothetical protein